MDVAKEAVTAVKSAIRPKTIIYGALGLIVIMALFELAGLTGFLVTPIAATKAFIAKRKASAA